MTDAIFAATGTISQVRICTNLPDVNLDEVGVTTFDLLKMPSATETMPFIVEVIDPVEDYAVALERAFDFPALRAFIARPDFSFVYDGMNGVAGPYGQ